MSNNFARNLRFNKAAVTGGGGMVASQNQAAADIGAGVLSAGGNAVDAAVTASFALAALEPWMSGLGGGGYMVVMKPGWARAQVIDFGLISAASLNPADYPLSPDGAGGDLFGWPPVLEDRNIKGYSSMAVPGEVAGMGLALERFGSLPWKEVLAPAIAVARRGLEVDWFSALLTTTVAKDLHEFQTSRETFLPGGFPKVPDWNGGKVMQHIGNLATTLERLATAGPGDFYRGEIAAALVRDFAAGGSPLTAQDLAGYQARQVEALSIEYGGAQLHVPPGLTAGPTLQTALRPLDGKLSGGQLDAAGYVAYAQALKAAYVDRFATMGHSGGTSCTTHLSVVDKDGTMVALTQTLLSLFGSKVMLPSTGVLMNNGVMWFDTRPGRPNSIAAGKQPLSNMCPVVASRDGQPWFAIGASGGRRIVPAVLQLASFLIDYGMDLETAFHTPRIDVSGGEQVVYDSTLEGPMVHALAKLGPVAGAVRTAYPLAFACPNAVLRDAAGGRSIGMAEVSSPWAGATAA